MSNSRVRAAASSEVLEGKLLRVEVGGRRVLLTRVNGKVHAVLDRCPHMGMSLAKGKLEGTTVTCPWHNSRFDICSGRNLDWASALLGMPMPKWTHGAIAMGKSPAPLTVLAAEESGGDIFLPA
ncbi:MAG: Rieske (2Fe-2S) protein [Gammaproteobacteria bacterium]|nr:Rieske (2Fe-2S) protein [Gammaproteobacteria bacterium]